MLIVAFVSIFLVCFGHRRRLKESSQHYQLAGSNLRIGTLHSLHEKSSFDSSGETRLRSPVRGLSSLLLEHNRRSTSRGALQHLRTPDPVTAIVYGNVLNAARQVNRMVDNISEEAGHYGELHWDDKTQAVTFWDSMSGKAKGWGNFGKRWMPRKCLSRATFNKLPRASSEQIESSPGLQAARTKALQRQDPSRWADAHAEVLQQDGSSLHKFRQGNWQSLFTGAVTHVGFEHLYSNLLTLCLLGTPVLHAVGPRALLKTFVASLFSSNAVWFAQQGTIAVVGRFLQSLFQRNKFLQSLFQRNKCGRDKVGKGIELRSDGYSNSMERVCVGLSGVVASLILPYLALLKTTQADLNRDHRQLQARVARGGYVHWSVHEWFQYWLKYCSWQKSVFNTLLSLDLIGLFVPGSPVAHAAHVGGLIAGIMLLDQVKGKSMYDNASMNVVVLSDVHKSLARAMLAGTGMVAMHMVRKRHDINWKAIGKMGVAKILKNIFKR